MTVQVEAPTGREVREHLERWEALPEGERPWPLERWDEVEQGWAVAGIYDRGLRYDDDTPQPGLRLVPLPQPETERVQAWVAIQQGRMAVTPDGKGLDLSTGDLIIHVEDGSATGYIMRDDASHPFENRPLVSPDGTVEVLVEPESATRPDPPEGWVVCRDREILRAADKRRMVRWWCGSWSDPLGEWDYDARYIDDDRYAVPADMIPEPWTPKLRDRVLVEAVVVHFDARDGGLRPAPGSLRVRVEDTSEVDGFVRFWSPPSALRPFPEDGEA